MKKIISTILVASLFPIYASAGTELSDGNAFWDSCHADPTPSQCWDYFSGMTHGTAQAFDVVMLTLYPGQHYDQFNATRQKLTNICFPKNATSGQVFDVFVKFLKDSPEKRNAATGLLYIVAMRQAFPCKAPDKTK